MKKTAFLLPFALATSAFAYEAKVTKGELPATLEAMISKASTETQVEFAADDFYLIENRALATSQFQMYVQHSEGVPVGRTAIRIWSNKETKELILAELHLDESAKQNEKALAQKYFKAKFSSAALKSKQLAKAVSKIVSAAVAEHDTDNKVLGIKSQDQWLNGDLVRKLEIRGRRGVHHITFSLLKNKITSKTYMEFPQSEAVYETLKANVYPIYEEVEGTGQRLPFEVKELKYINKQIADGGENPLSVLERLQFTEEFYNPILAETTVGQEYGFWSEAAIRRKVESVVAGFPLKTNDLASGLLLQGKYVTVNLHPDAKDLGAIDFPLKKSVNHINKWSNANGYWEAKPTAGLSGKPIVSESDVANLIPERLADHDPVAYINNGFDEIQVYYAVTVLMESLSEMGFEDAELSTKPFHAFLYDPDISMKDNAYYTDNTINFTTYSPEAQNYARDNSTIWHELGHGVMDRLMGPHLLFEGGIGYGGLSEGMADFLAKIVVEHQTSGAAFPGKNDFRIVNQIGFYLTNEFHDEGEAYGGVMSDMLDDAITKSGRQGLYDFTDLTLEAMRLTRNHPDLSPRAWYEHMLYADALGSSVREPNQFKELIEKALVKRNFSFDPSFKPAGMKVTFGETELTDTSEASRENPIRPCGTNGKVSYDLKVKLNGGDAEFIKFPATVKVEFKKGALQGAINWEGEANNPMILTVNSADEELTIPITASTKCDSINQPDGSCKDYAYLQVWNQGEAKPRAKKRFYLKIKDGQECAATR